MKILNARIHGYIDFVMIAAFFFAPAILNFSQAPSTASYVLGAIHLGLVMVTAYPFGLIKAVPFTVHGGIEFALSLTLMIFPGTFNAVAPAERGFFIGAGAALLLVWFLTDYKTGIGYRGPSKETLTRQAEKVLGRK